MKGFFDSSVLVPVFYGDHVHHKASLDSLHPVRQIYRVLRGA